MSTNPFTASFDGDAGSVETWSGLHGSSRAIALLAAAQKAERLALVVMRSSHQAQMLHRDLELLAFGNSPVLLFPDHETLPYDPFSPHPDIIADRLKTLSDLGSLKRGLLVCSIGSLLQRLPPADYILQRSFNLQAGQTLVLDDFRNRLGHAGYEVSEQVYQAGQFAVRGSVIDLFPSGSKTPFRIDLFDEEIDSIRVFDPDSQRSSGKVDAIKLLPAREYPCDEAGLESFRKAFRDRFDVDTRNVNLYQDLRAGVHPQGLEQYLPLFYESTSSLFNYLPDQPILVLQDGAFEASNTLARRTEERWEQRRYDVERPILDPQELFFSPAEARAKIDDCPQVHLPASDAPPAKSPKFKSEAVPDLHIHERGREAAATLKDYLETFPGRVVFAAANPPGQPRGSYSLLGLSQSTGGDLPC